MKKYILIFIIFILFIFGQVYFIGNQIGLGDQIFNLNKLIDTAKLENIELEKEIATESSYNGISQKANELNYVQAAAVMKVKNEGVALKR